MSKACIDRSDSLIFQHKRRPRVIGFTYASTEVHFRSTESQTFYRSIMTADDSSKCRCANSGMTGQVGGFQTSGVCLQVFPSFIPHPLPALLHAPFFARSLTLVPLSLLLNRTETLATQAIRGLNREFTVCITDKPRHKMKNGYIWENKQETIAGVIKLISYNLAIKFDCNQSNLIAGRINSGICNSSLKGSGEILNNITCLQL